MSNLIKSFKYLPTSSKIIIIFVPLSFLIIVALIILLYFITLSPSPSSIITIVDYNSLPISIPQEKRDELSSQVYYLLTENFDVPEESNATTAVIRPETFTDTSNDSISTVSFIMDIDAYQQSYQAYVSWSNTGEWLPEDILIECAENSLSKYPNVPCYGMYFNSDDIDLYLPYTGTIENGLEYTIKTRYYPDGEPYLEVAIDSCGNQTILDQALAAAKAWLTSNQLNPNDYTFEVPSHYCADGGL